MIVTADLIFMLALVAIGAVMGVVGNQLWMLWRDELEWKREQERLEKYGWQTHGYFPYYRQTYEGRANDDASTGETVDR